MNETLLAITMGAFTMGTLIGMGFFFCAAMDDAPEGVGGIIWFFTGAVLFWGGGLTALYGWFWSSTAHGLLATLIGAGVLAVIALTITLAIRRDQHLHPLVYRDRAESVEDFFNESTPLPRAARMSKHY